VTFLAIDTIIPIPFETPVDLRSWLEANHSKEAVLWIKLFKKKSGIPSIDWGDCVIEALAWGWIDGQKKSWDEESYIQRVKPRRKNSPWSMINKRHAEKLIKTGRMSAHGLEQVAIAQQNGQWDAAYYGSKEFELQEDFLAALEGHPVAKEFLQTLDRTNQHAIYLRLQSVVKPAVRAKRLEAILEKLDRHERLER
jgi:uncharacterized protein YdeI (YjbR/CyaY-like superfamily)